MCDEFGSSMDVSGDVSTDNDVSCEESSIDFESEGIFDTPQDDIQTDISDGTGDDVYEASSLDEIQEHKEALEDLKSALLAGDANALEMFGLETPDTSEEEGHQKVLTR